MLPIASTLNSRDRIYDRHILPKHIPQMQTHCTARPYSDTENVSRFINRQTCLRYIHSVTYAKPGHAAAGDR
jgi:hypothetical protein